MKKTISLFLSLIMVMGVLLSVPVTVNAASVNDLGFELNADGRSYSVIGCDPNASGELVIPSMYENKPVTKIDMYAFGTCDSLTSIIIPNSVTSIGAYAFNYCSGLRSITIPDSVTSIGNWAFKDCSNLRSVTIPGSVKSIGMGAFYSCCKLESVSIADGVTSIGDEAFYCCEWLEVISIPESVKNIGYDAFAETENIEQIYLGNNVALEYLVYYIDHKDVKNVVLGEAVSYVPDNAFRDCWDLEYLTIGNNVVYIYSGAFYNCQKLKYLTIGNNVESIGGSAFYNCRSLTTINIPDSVTTIDVNAFSYCEALESITMGNSLENIYKKAFYGCKKLSKVYISDLAKWCAINFDGECANPLELAGNLYINGDLLNHFVIPKGVTSINNKVFYNCKNLKSIEIPESVRAIGANAFYGCNNLKSVKAICDSYAVVYFNDNSRIKLDLVHNSISDWIVGKVPTCMQEGMRYKKCWYCSATMETETLPKEEHTIVKDSAVEATCTKAGKTEGSHCSYCHEVIEPQTIVAAKGHTSSDWLIDQNATLNAKGKKHKECTECGKVLETATIKQLKCSKPSLKKIENAADGVKITWGKVKGADSYDIYRKTGSGKYKKIGTTSKTYYTDKKAKSGKKYYYIVKAVNEAGSSSSSSSLSKYYLADPTLKTPSSTKKGITLKWSKVTGAEGYMVYCKTGSGDYKKIATVKGSSKVTYTDKSAKKGKKYTYKVKAYKSKSYSTYSNTKTITDKY